MSHETADGSVSGVLWMQFIAEWRIENGCQFDPIFLNPPDCLYIKRNCFSFQNYEDSCKTLHIFVPKKEKMKEKWKKSLKNLQGSKKSITFAPAIKEITPRFLAPRSSRKDGWVAETSSLLNCRTGSRTGGSNPPPSAPRGFSLRERSFKCWSIHLMVRIQDSQSWHRGSIPLSTTKKHSKPSVNQWFTEDFSFQGR